MSIKKSIKKLMPYKLKMTLKRLLGKQVDISYMPLSDREQGLKKLYLKRMGEELDLKNPKLFTEKLQCYKLYYRLPDMRKCVDKYQFKKYITEKLGEEYTAKLITVWNKPSEVSIKDVPCDKFVIKSNLQSDGNKIILVKNKNDINIKETEEEIKNHWFNPTELLINSYCSAYYGAKPRVIIEEFVEEFEGCANDYKVFCFDGKPNFIYVAEEHFEDGKNTDYHPITFYDLDWNVMDVKYGNHEINENVARPKHLNEMIEISKKLSKEFPFVRVDFFDTDEKLYLAELTFYPGGGMTHYHPREFNEKMGNMFNLK